MTRLRLTSPLPPTGVIHVDVLHSLVLPVVESAAVAVLGSVVAAAGVEAKRWLSAHGLLQKVQAGVTVANAVGLTPQRAENAVAGFLSVWLTQHGHRVSAQALEAAMQSVAAAAAKDLAAQPVTPTPPATPVAQSAPTQ